MEKDQWGRRIVDPDEYLRIRRAEARRIEEGERQFAILVWFAIGTIMAVVIYLALLWL